MDNQEQQIELEIPTLNEKEDLYGDSRDYPSQPQMEMKARQRIDFNSLSGSSPTDKSESILTPEDTQLQEVEESEQDKVNRVIRDSAPDLQRSVNHWHYVANARYESSTKRLSLIEEQEAIIKSLDEGLASRGSHLTYSQLYLQGENHPDNALLQGEDTRFAVQRLAQLDELIAKESKEIIAHNEEVVRVIETLQGAFDAVTPNKDLLHLGFTLTEGHNTGLYTAGSFKDAVYTYNDMMKQPDFMFYINDNADNAHPISKVEIGETGEGKGLLFRILDTYQSNKTGQPVYLPPMLADDFVSGWDFLKQSIKDNPYAVIGGVAGEFVGISGYLGAAKFITKKMLMSRPDKLAQGLLNQVKLLGQKKPINNNPKGLNYFAMLASGSAGATVGELTGAFIDRDNEEGNLRELFPNAEIELNKERSREEIFDTAGSIFAYTLLGGLALAGAGKVYQKVRDSNVDTKRAKDWVKRLARNTGITEQGYRDRVKTLFEEFGIDTESLEYQALRKNENPDPAVIQHLVEQRLAGKITQKEFEQQSKHPLRRAISRIWNAPNEQERKTKWIRYVMDKFEGEDKGRIAQGSYWLAKKIANGADGIRNFIGEDQFLPPEEIEEALATLLFLFKKDAVRIGSEKLSTTVGNINQLGSLQALLKTTEGEVFRLAFERFAVRNIDTKINNVITEQGGFSTEMTAMERVRAINFQTQMTIANSRAMSIAAFPDNDRNVHLGLKKTPSNDKLPSMSVDEVYDRYQEFLVNRGRKSEVQAINDINLLKNALDKQIDSNVGSLPYPNRSSYTEKQKFDNLFTAFTTNDFAENEYRRMLSELEDNSGNKLYTEQQIKDMQFISGDDIGLDVEDYYAIRSHLTSLTTRKDMIPQVGDIVQLLRFLDNSFDQELSNRGVNGGLVKGFDSEKLIQEHHKSIDMFRKTEQMQNNFELVRSVVNGALQSIKGKPKDWDTKHAHDLYQLYGDTFGVALENVYSTFHPEEIASLEANLFNWIITKTSKAHPINSTPYTTIGGAVSALKHGITNELEYGIGFLTPEIEHAKNQLYAFHDLFPFADAILDLNPQYSRISTSVSDGFSTSVSQRLLVSGVGTITAMIWNRIPHTFVKNTRRKYRDLHTTIVGDKLVRQLHLNIEEATSVLDLHSRVYGEEFTKLFVQNKKAIEEIGGEIRTIDQIFASAVEALKVRRYLLDREGHGKTLPRRTKDNDPKSIRNVMLNSKPFYLDRTSFKILDRPTAAALYYKGFRDNTRMGEGNVLQWRNQRGESINPLTNVIYVDPKELTNRNYVEKMMKRWGVPIEQAEEFYRLIVQSVRKNAGVKAKSRAKVPVPEKFRKEETKKNPFDVLE